MAKRKAKKYNNLHNRLVTTPFDKIKEEEKQFANYKASDFKVPGRYKLFGRQCDNIASEIVNAGGVEYFVNIVPNLSYYSIWSPNKWSIE